MRRQLSRAAMLAGALSLTAAAPAAAQNATIASTGVAKKRLHVRTGENVKVVGAARPATGGLWASLQIRVKGRWRTIDRARTAVTGRYVLRDRRHGTISAQARVRVAGRASKVGRLNVYRWAQASWYGPGLYGNSLACGGRLNPGTVGVAHKSLPCGSKLTLRHRGRTLRVRVIDRGPYVGGREYDLTEATAQKLRFRGHGSIQSTR